MTDLRDKSIIITGGASGIGEAASVLAANYGARVTVADVNEDLGQQITARIRDAGGAAQFVRTDISKAHDVEALVEAAVTTHGGLHGAFNNAGVPPFSASRGGTFTPFADLSVDLFQKALDVNVVGTFLCMKYEIPAMLASGGGSIVNNSSGAGILAVAGAPDYVASKHAVIGLTKSAALDYATQGIRVNALLPGVTRTPMVDVSFETDPNIAEWAANAQPNKRLGEPAEVAEGAMWLLSDAASLVTGISMPVDGGFTMV